MAQVNLTLSEEELLELLAGNREEAFKHLVEKLLNQVLMAESAAQLQAEPYERSDDRKDYRNGTRDRKLVTRIGTLELVVPRHRNEPFQTALFDNYSRSETALINTMIEMVINGVSTRKVSRVVEQLCGTSVSKSLVSEVCKELDPEIEAFRKQPLDEREFPFLMVDATYFKVREDHKVVPKALMVAIGYTEEGRREILGFNVYDNESNSTWFDFLSDLKKRGLHGVMMVTSDAHPAILNAIVKVFPGVPWQRCQFHLTRNIIDAAPKKEQAGLAAELRELFTSDTIEAARHKKEEILSDYSDAAPHAMDILDNGFEDSMTVMNLPKEVRTPLRTSNAIERLNYELKRRSDVIKVFPNAASLLRTMGAVIMEYNDRYSMMKSLFYKITKTKLDDKTRSKLQEIAFAQKSLLEAA
jgi:transposase-like protein